jgi:hypothetical protein
MSRELTLADFHPNIQKGFIDSDLEKGTYANNAQNRKMGRVGQSFGGGKEKESAGDNMGSIDVKKLTDKYSYMKNQLEGVTGKVNLILTDRENVSPKQDKFMMEIHQNGKKIADLGTFPNKPMKDYISKFN